MVSVFGIEIDTNLFEARIPAEKLLNAKLSTSKALSKKALTLHEVQSLTGFLSFCAQVVRLGWVFMQKLWDFVASFSIGCSRFAKRRIPSDVRADLQWWNELLPVYNEIQFFDTSVRKTVQLYTDASLQGLGGVYYENHLDFQFWSEAALNIPQDHAFAVPVSTPAHINVHELEAILLTVET